MMLALFLVLSPRPIVSILLWRSCIWPVLWCLKWFTSSIDETDVYDFHWARALISCPCGGALCWQQQLQYPLNQSQGIWEFKWPPPRAVPTLMSTKSEPGDLGVQVAYCSNSILVAIHMACAMVSCTASFKFLLKQCACLQFGSSTSFVPARRRSL